ncbi:MAG: Lrp/AsnC family transcriptional regulator [Chloroflexota bacterium]|nr:Lrp/AsnC family transcriptional regulator [Chloroflexota bacterium]
MPDNNKLMIDSIDKPLIQLLGGDALQSSEVLAKQLNVSAATVRRRIRRLIKDGTLRIVAVVDPNKVGLPLAALLALDVPYEQLDMVTDALAEHPDVKWVSTTTGRFNIMAMVRSSSTDDLATFMQKELPRLEGVKNSETLICLRVKKGQYIRI